MHSTNISNKNILYNFQLLLPRSYIVTFATEFIAHYARLKYLISIFRNTLLFKLLLLEKYHVNLSMAYVLLLRGKCLDHYGFAALS